MTPDEMNQRKQEYRQKALAHFPLKVIETTGDKALATWQELKSAGQGSPVVLGGDDEIHPFKNLLTPFSPHRPNVPPLRSVEEILGAAAGISFPDDLAKRKKADSEAALGWFKAHLAANPTMPLPRIIEIKEGKTRTYTREETIADMEREPYDPPLGNGLPRQAHPRGFPSPAIFSPASRCRRSISASRQPTIGRPFRPISATAVGMIVRQPTIMSPRCGPGASATAPSSSA
jgi:hypothetical protein